MKTGIRWYSVVLHAWRTQMLTSILLGVQSPGAIESLSANRSLDVDRPEHALDTDDTAGPPILFVKPLVDDQDQVERSLVQTVGPVESDGEQGRDCETTDDEDDLDSDWPLFVSGSNDETGRELRLYADDGDAMRAAGIFGGNSGGFAPTVSGGMVDLMRHREPIETVDFYVL